MNTRLSLAMRLRLLGRLIIFLAAGLVAAPLDAAAGESPRAWVITDAHPERATRHGIHALVQALEQKGITVQQGASLKAASSADLIVVAGSPKGDGSAAELCKESDIQVPSAPESLRIHPMTRNGKSLLLVSGADDRGLMYGLLDAADRIGWARDASGAFREIRDATESPDVSDRGLSIYTMQRKAFEQRLFNRTYWESYFDMLARDRFNSFVIVFGYENGGYMAPAYPYFFNVDGFPGVRVVNFSREQQEKYLAALNSLIEIAHDRGLEVTLGLWDHIYRGGVQAGGVKEADPNQPAPGIVWGLNKDNLTAYSTAALAKFLKVVPAMDGVQFRMHSESGLKPGREMHDFWRDIYGVVKQVRPNLRFDARAKEFPDDLIDLALEMGVNLRICTKYWAEQMGLPFHPTHINRQNQFDRRHGYADLLRYPQRYPMQWRLWNGGTTRVLLWGDPEYARRFAGSTHLYNGTGFEVNEMLATKMEAQPHDLAPFDLLRPGHQYYQWEFQRYWHFYQVFGRIGYNPATPAEVWDREFAERFGPAAGEAIERALHRASWVLPRINASIFPYGRFPTTRGWVEKQRWEDLPGYASCEGSDTQQFESFGDAAQSRMDGSESAKLSPEHNSAWFAETADAILKYVAQAERQIGSKRSKEFESTVVDLRILANLALYHSRRIPAGVQYAAFQKSHDLNALDDAIEMEQRAVEAWEQIVAAAGDFYADDLMMGLRSAGLSGHWKDERSALRRGLVNLETLRTNAAAKRPASLSIAHLPVRKAMPGQTIRVRATVTGPAAIKSVRLKWRNATSDVQEVLMASTGPGRYQADLPPAKDDSRVEYRIEAADASGGHSTFPASSASPWIAVRISADREPPALHHEPVAHAAAGQPLTITARVSDPAGVKWVRLRYRGVTQFQDYATVEMVRTGQPDEYSAVVPGAQISPKWDFMYLFEVMDEEGNGRIYPDLDHQTPYIVVKLQR